MKLFKNLKFFILLKLIILILASCGTVREGFTNQKKNSSDEFLVEKKSPLVMPPNYDDLPKPDSKDNSPKSNNNIKGLISTNQKNNPKNNNSGNLEGSILEKIKID